MEDVLLQYGAIGVIATICIVAVRIMFGKLTEALEHERERADRLEKELGKINESVRGEYLGTIANATRAIADALAAV
ncbi:MAG TPA: hypothetical protein VHV10_04770, partial [Ktedonobacteraceae bacterium]|nr:hypothetical protein [Ktedonobacteraceae bacterium]